jgi:hypothetical protein
MENNKFRMKVIELSLRDMFSPDKFFSICTIDKIIEATGVCVNRDEYNFLNMLHCVHWADMEPEMRKEVFARTIKLFEDGTVFDFNRIDGVVKRIVPKEDRKKTLKIIGESYDN